MRRWRALSVVVAVGVGRCMTPRVISRRTCECRGVGGHGAGDSAATSELASGHWRGVTSLINTPCSSTTTGPSPPVSEYMRPAAVGPWRDRRAKPRPAAQRHLRVPCNLPQLAALALISRHTHGRRVRTLSCHHRCPKLSKLPAQSVGYISACVKLGEAHTCDRCQ